MTALVTLENGLSWFWSELVLKKNRVIHVGVNSGIISAAETLE